MLTVTETANPTFSSSTCCKPHRNPPAFTKPMATVSNFSLQSASRPESRSNLSDALCKRRSAGTIVSSKNQSDSPAHSAPGSPLVTAQIEALSLLSQPSTPTLCDHSLPIPIPDRPSPGNDSFFLNGSHASSSVSSFEAPPTGHSGRKTSLSMNLFKSSLTEYEARMAAFTVVDDRPSGPASTPCNTPCDYFSTSNLSLKESSFKSQDESLSDCDGDMDDSGPNEEEFKKLFDRAGSPTSVTLQPFANQVGGHTSLFRFSKKAVCKPLVRRENSFYEILETRHPELLPFVPQYLGVLNVSCRSHDGMPEVEFEQNKHLMPPWMLARIEGADEMNDASLIGDPRSRGRTKVNQKLRDAVIREVFSPRVLQTQRSSREVGDQSEDNSIRQIRQMQKEPCVKRRHSMIRAASSDPSDLEMVSDLRSYSDPKATKIKRALKYRSMSSPAVAVNTGMQPALDGGDTSADLRKSYEPAADEYHHCAPHHQQDSSPVNSSESQSLEPSVRTLEMSPPRDETHELLAMDDDSDDTGTAQSHLARRTSAKKLRLDMGEEKAVATWAKSNNSWSLRCYTTQLSKLRSQEAKDDVRQFILLEDLTGGLEYPCVLDLKMGTRQHSINASSEKRKSQMKKCAKTTSAILGVRICGMQVYKHTTNEFQFQDKYYGRSLNADSFRLALEDFLDNGNNLILWHVPTIVRKLRRLAKIIRRLANYRFYASSLLLIYDGDPQSQRDIDIRIIDFAHCTTGNDYRPDEIRFPPTHEGFDRGYVLGLKNLCRSFEAIYSERCGKPLGDVGEDEDGVFEGIGLSVEVLPNGLSLHQKPSVS